MWLGLVISIGSDVCAARVLTLEDPTRSGYCTKQSQCPPRQPEYVDAFACIATGGGSTGLYNCALYHPDIWSEQGMPDCSCLRDCSYTNNCCLQPGLSWYGDTYT